MFTKTEPKSPKHEAAKAAIVKNVADMQAYYLKKQVKLLNALESIPESIPVVYDGWDGFILETTDKKLFTKLSKILGSEVKKSVNESARTGQLQIYSDGITVRSGNISLPDSCTFKEVIETRTYTKLVPVGNCGSWFEKTEEERMSAGSKEVA